MGGYNFISCSNQYVPAWKEAMDLEVEALVSHKTWTLVLCSADADIVTCKWVIDKLKVVVFLSPSNLIFIN